MIEVRVHGRGGQGGKMAMQILARTAYLSGFKTQDFAMYGAERKGAPVTSFCRFDRQRVSTRGYIFEPDYIMILDDSLDIQKCLKGMKPNTILIINSNNKYKNIKNSKVVDATNIALERVGRPIANVALLGGLLKYLPDVDIKHLPKAVEIELGEYGKETVEKNVKAAMEAYDEIC